MTLPVIILGGGGHAKVVLDALILRGIPVIGYTVPDQRNDFEMVEGIKNIGNDTEVFRYDPDSVLLANGLGSVRYSIERRRVFSYFIDKGYRFATVIHPSSVIASDVKICEGAQVMAGAIIQTGSCIGRNTIVNTKASVDHDCLIGDHVHIAPGVTLSGGIQVGEATHLGTGAIVIQGVRVGNGSLIAAGSVVTRDVPDGVTVRGVPAKVVLI